MAVTILRPATSTDRYGNVIPDWTGATSTAVDAWISQRASTEAEAGRDTVATTLGMFVDADVDIEAGDRVVVDGETWEVDGRPLRARTPRGVHHLEVGLRTVTG